MLLQVSQLRHSGLSQSRWLDCWSWWPIYISKKYTGSLQQSSRVAALDHEGGGDFCLQPAIFDDLVHLLEFFKLWSTHGLNLVKWTGQPYWKQSFKYWYIPFRNRLVNISEKSNGKLLKHLKEHLLCFCGNDKLCLMLFREERALDEVKIALVGKYTKLEDAYISVLKALKHASLHCNRRLNVVVSFSNYLSLQISSFTMCLSNLILHNGCKLCCHWH